MTDRQAPRNRYSSGYKHETDEKEIDITFQATRYERAGELYIDRAWMPDRVSKETVIAERTVEIQERRGSDASVQCSICTPDA